jgi:CRISPR/Cas system-associated endoribonuclease Cas2
VGQFGIEPNQRTEEKKMALYVLAYDIHKPYTEYEGLEEHLRSINAKRVQESVWAFNSDGQPPLELRRMFQGFIHEPGDRILVVRVKQWSSWNAIEGNIEDMSY